MFTNRTRGCDSFHLVRSLPQASRSLSLLADKCYLHGRGSAVNAQSEAPGCSEAETECPQIEIQQHYLSGLLDLPLRSEVNGARAGPLYRPAKDAAMTVAWRN